MKQLGNKLLSQSIKVYLEERVSWIWLLLRLLIHMHAVVRRFGSSSIVGCSEKSSVITKSFESHFELDSSSLEMKVLKKKFLLI